MSKPPKALLEAETRLEKAALDAFNAWLPEVLDAVLYGEAPIVAASGKKKLAISAAALEFARRTWAARADWILSAARNVFTEQYNAAKGLADRLIVRRAAFAGRMRTKLENVANEVFDSTSKLIHDGITAGKTEEQLAHDLREHLDPSNDRWANHASLIGHTEGPAAFNAGALEGHLQADGASSLFKEWISESDGRVRLSHVEVTGTKVPLNAKFTVGGFTADHPGDESLPAHEACNCRCWLRFGTASELGIVAAPDGKMDHMDERMEALVASIMAAVETRYATDGALPNGWRGVMAPLNRPTGDERQLNVPPGGVRTRQMPVEFRFQPAAIGGHDGAVMAGRVDYVWVEDGFVMGEGALDLGGEWGAEYARRLGEGFAQTLSVDPDEVTFEQQFFNADGEQVPFNEAVIQGDGDPRLQDGYAVRDVMVDWRFAGVTAVSIPAFDEARIEPVYDYVPRTVTPPVPVMSSSEALSALLAAADVEEDDGDVLLTLARAFREAYAREMAEVEAYEEAEAIAATALSEEIVASAAGGQVFNSAFFANPELTGPTPLTVDEDGRVYGHVATWGACYMAFGGQANKPCISVPFSSTDYERFKVHGAKMDDGSIQRVGAITFGDGHRTAGGLIPSQRLYADVASVAAKVTVGEDEFGIWVSGEVVDEFRDRAYDLLLSPLSGHWEPDGDVGGQLEMLAAHVVVAPGFKVPRLIASVGPDGEYLAVQFAGVSTEIGEELFAEADAEGRIEQIDTREDGAIIYELSPESKAAILADRRAQRAMLRMRIDPNSRAADALARLIKE